jgi:hypothetical protein
MAAEEIEVPAGVPSWQQRIELDGVLFYLACTLNERTDRWHYSLSDSNNVPIIEGRRMLVGRDLLRGIASTARPKGMLIVTDFTGTDSVQPTFANFGNTLFLVYVPEADVP